MKQTRSLAIAIVTGAVSSSAALAHGGHPVPASVPVQDHLHLSQTVMVPGSVVLALLFAVAVIGAVVWRRGVAARAGIARRGDGRRDS